jgi:hypothetical protein
MVLLTVGVHSGTNGPLLYTADDLQKSVPGWNGRPIVAPLHPHGGAGRPEAFDEQRIGTVFNAQFDGVRLSAEAWIDQERVARIDPRVEDAIIHNRRMEVSTGLFHDVDGRHGTWNGEDYISSAINHVPDHLAILPDKVGACSINDGCGLLVGNVHKEEPMPLLQWV